MRGSKVPAHLLPSLRAKHPSFQGPGEYVQVRKEPSCILILELTKNMTNRPPSRENAYECSVRYVFHSGFVCRTHPEEHKGSEAKLIQHCRGHLPNNEVIHLKKRLAFAGRGMSEQKHTQFEDAAMDTPLPRTYRTLSPNPPPVISKELTDRGQILFPECQR
jgi:hypothetical protein